MGEITVKDTSAPLGATVTFLDAKGAPAVPEDVPQWTSSDEGVASVVAADDGLTAEVTVGVPGAAVIQVSSTQTDDVTGEPNVVVAQGGVFVQPSDAVIGSVEFTEP